MGEALGVFRTPSASRFTVAALNSIDEDDEARSCQATRSFSGPPRRQDTLELALMMWKPKSSRCGS